MRLPLHAFAPAGHPGSPAAVRPGGSGFGSSCRGAASASAGARCPDLPVHMGGPPARKRPLSTPVGARRGATRGALEGRPAPGQRRANAPRICARAAALVRGRPARAQTPGSRSPPLVIIASGEDNRGQGIFCSRAACANNVCCNLQSLNLRAQVRCRR